MMAETSGDITLKDFQRLVNEWIDTVGHGYYAPLTNMAILTEEVGEVARIMAREEENLTEEKARAKANKINKLRANYYNFYTDKTWGAASSYDMSLDTSVMSMDQLVEVIVEYLSRRFPDEDFSQPAEFDSWAGHGDAPR